MARTVIFLRRFCALLLVGCLLAGMTPGMYAGVWQRGLFGRPGKVRLQQNNEGRWQLLVDGKPYMIRGVEYSADRVGTNPDTPNEWMWLDTNGNGRIDGPYDSYIDANADDFQDTAEDTVGDFKLLQQMGCNTIRIYHSDNINKELLRDLYQTYGIRVIMGNLLGAYTVGSGADWSCGTDYASREQQKNMRDSVRRMVEEHKDEPYILCWMLGNENDTAGSAENSTCNNTNAAAQPQEFASFVNDICAMIHALDPDHPVGVCNATTKLLPYYAKYAPEVDIFGINQYAGPFGFGTLWGRVKAVWNRPVLITEFGADCYDQNRDVLDEASQANYHRKAWKDIEANSFWGPKTGNAIGGMAYSWLDKWWLCGSAKVHDTRLGAWKGPVMDGWFNDEWLGLCGQGRGLRSPFLRQPRLVYRVYRDELWGEVPQPYAYSPEAGRHRANE